MGILEQVTEMKKLGASDEEILTALREQGISPRQIKDALDQSQIKEAVYDEGREQEQLIAPSPRTTRTLKSSYAPKSQEINENEEEPYQPQQGYGYQEQQPAQQQGLYQPETYEYPQETTTSFGTDTMIEVAEQVFSEKMKKASRKLSELNEFKTIAEAKLENVLERVKRIEEMIDKLQVAILERVGSYGRNIDNMKKELSMVQDSFGKIVNKIPNTTPKREEFIPDENPFEEVTEEELSPLEQNLKGKVKSKKTPLKNSRKR